MPSEDHLQRLPSLERDILRLHQELRKPQTEIARILGCSQPTVNYRYKRVRARLEFLEKLPSVTPDEIRQVLRTLGAREQDIEAMILYVETTSQSEVARRMKTSQGAVRYWVLRVLTDHLQKDMREDDLHKRVRTVCGMLTSKPGIGIFNEPQKPGDVPKHKKVQRRLSVPPKFTGTLAVGEQIRILDGIYQSLDGVLVELTETEMRVRLGLESQEITLSWPR
jgi:DNA-directed RNA polymerase specialized sigma24 family protein